MKSGKWMAVLLASLLLAGCKDFWKAPASSSGTGGTGASSGIFYVANQATDQVAAYSIVSGTLTKVSGSPFTLTAAPRTLALSPDGTLLYVGTLGGGVFAFSVGSGGGLTALNSGAAVAPSELPFAMQVDPSGTWLVDAFPTSNSNGVQVDAIPITASGTVDQSRAEQSPAFNLAGASVYALAISPDGGHVFVAAGTAGTLVIPFSHSNASPLGASSAITIQPLNTGGSALSVAVDPNNRLFYIGETLASASGKSGGLRAINYSSLGGTLTNGGGSPIDSGGLAPAAILPDASGSYVFVANGQGTTSAGNVQSFSITAGGTTTAPTYSLATVGSGVKAGTQPSGLAEDSQAQYVLEINSSGSPDLEAYTMSSGALTSAVTGQTGTDPVQATAIAALH
jgi:DNA-binding beta-propeller fold protein YncE